MDSLATIQRINNAAARRALAATPEPTDTERAGLVAEAKVNNAQPVLTEHEESLKLPGETSAEFVARTNRDS